MKFDEQTSQKLDFSEFRLETISLLRLGSHWQNILLSGHHWRLYHHPEPGVFLIDKGKVIELKTDKIYILPPYCDLRGRFEGEPLQLFLHFNASGFSGNMKYRCNELDIDEDLQNFLDIIYSELTSVGAESGRLMLAAISLAARSMLTLPKEAVEELKSDENISMLCERMRLELQLDWTLSRLSRISKLSEKNLLQKFKEATNTTPFQYLLHMRYARAARLLQVSNLSIEEICESIGINDRFHFSRRFKRLYGFPPATYRKYYSGEIDSDFCEK